MLIWHETGSDTYCSYFQARAAPQKEVSIHGRPFPARYIGMGQECAMWHLQMTRTIMAAHSLSYVGLAFLLGALTQASTASASALEDGREVAVRKCSGCHAIAEDGVSPNAKAPPFRVLNTRYPIDALRESFLKGIEVGHEMPTFTLAPQEVTNLLIYLRSLDPCSKSSSDKAAMARCFAPMKE